MGDELRADDLPDESLQVGGHSRHPLLQKLGEGLSEGDEFSDTFGPFLDL